MSHWPECPAQLELFRSSVVDGIRVYWRDCGLGNKQDVLWWHVFRRYATLSA